MHVTLIKATINILIYTFEKINIKAVIKIIAIVVKDKYFILLKD
jgi:hypothetical protein